MKKIAMLLAVLMVAGAAPGWCLIATVDGYVTDTTSKSGYKPIEDVGVIYTSVNDGISTSLDKMTGSHARPMLLDPIDKVLRTTLDGTKTIVNGVWDLVTFKSMRTPKA
ncbi:MAG: hypothetical protein FGM27_05800 [Candidatus Omnitrophica bacterium]|nr:hypothetical protein [Candidatus Omnitrophota bacterium]